MTPIQDHGFDRRQRLIKDPRSAAKLHYQTLIAKGLREDDAANMAQWHPLDEFDSFFGKFVLWMVVGMITILLFILANTVQAANDLEGSAASEAAFARCLSGENIKFSDGSRWMCIKVGMK